MQLRFHGYNFFFEATGASLIAAWPFVMQLLAHWGLDPVSRHWRKLQPLRESMRDAVPGTAFDLGDDPHGRRRTLLQLHQSTVEIRDAVLQLRPFFSTSRPPRPTAIWLPTGSHRARATPRCARCDSHARCNNKAAGAAAKAADVADVFAASRSATLDDEIRELLTWPAGGRPPLQPPRHLDPSTERRCH